MKLNFARAYNSILSLNETTIDNFCVITGLNGSGKTHLLKAISEGAVSVIGIDSSEIIYYNYNDFNVHNGDPGTDQQIQQLQSTYIQKTNIFSNNINAERNNALNSYTPLISIGTMRLDVQAFQYIEDFEVASSWSEDDYDLYEARAKEFDSMNYGDFPSSLPSLQSSLFQRLGIYEVVPDIRSFISELKNSALKADAYLLIRNFGYSKRLIDWNIEELQALPMSLPELFQKIWDGSLHDTLSPGLFYFLQASAGSSNVTSNPSVEKLAAIRSATDAIFEEIEQHFVANISENTLKIIKAMNGPDKILDPVTIGSGFLNLHEIAAAEKQYQTQKKANEYYEFEHYKGKQSNFLSDDEFIIQYGDSPVDTLNKVLAEYDCNGYEFKQSELHYTWGMDISNQQIQIDLYNKRDNYYTSLASLSSGERTLLALAFIIFKLRQRKVIAKLLLMDEIDSALHPSMSKRLLTVLHNLFYKELGINIIISTHSPSTVAFAPEESNYIMRRDGEPRLTKVSKDQALSELTTGVPSFSVNYENRRQVFVESQYDAQFYEALYNIYKDHLDPEISLNFISSGDSHNNTNGIGVASCDQVNKITSILRESGNKSIWGIVDWDLNTRKPQCQYVKVLGYNSRYNIENYLLDPLLIGILLWREKYVEPSFFGLANGTKIHEALSFGPANLQVIIDAVIKELSNKISGRPEGVSSYALVNNVVLSIPTWFCNFQGHKLEEKYLSAFPLLNTIKRNKEAALKQAVIDKVIDDFPDFAPIDLLDIFKQVQEL